MMKFVRRNFSSYRHIEHRISKDRVKEHVLNGVTFTIENSVFKHANELDNKFMNRLFENNISTDHYNSKYSLNYENLDIIDCITEILFNMSTKYEYTYFPPQCILGRTLVQSGNGVRWTIGNTSASSVQDAMPSRVIEKEVGYVEVSEDVLHNINDEGPPILRNKEIVYRPVSIRVLSFPCYSIIRKIDESFEIKR